MIVMKVISAANGARTPHNGRYLVTANPNTRFGMLQATSTDDIDKAMRIEDAVAFHKLWAAVSEVQPVRPDGKPNRPLTALTIELVTVEK
jgi:hypothetical protein